MHPRARAASEASPIVAERTASLEEDSSEDDGCNPFAESDLDDEDELAGTNMLQMTPKYFMHAN